MRRKGSLSMSVSLFEGLAAAGLSIAAGWIANDSLAALAVIVLLVGLKLVATDDRLHVLQAAYAFHWLQTSLGLFYVGFTGREVPAIYQSDYRPMVLIAFGCCLAIAIGVRIGLMLIAPPPEDEDRPDFAVSIKLLAIIYVSTVMFESGLTAVAADYPTIRQIIVTMDTARLGVLFLIFRHLFYPVTRWSLIAAVLGLEVGLGITGFFAGFREPIVLAGLAMVEFFDRHNSRHWIAAAGAAVIAVMLGLLWMGVRVDYRREYVDVDSFQSSRSARVSAISSLGSEWFHNDANGMWQTADRLVDRMWTIYYPALALRRVPESLPHTNGEILQAALLHIVTPRIFFPGKPDLPSDSDKVRKYSNVRVAGAERNTSIAFGYAIEAYIDYGLPLMFLPVLCFGLALGVLYALFRKLVWHRDLFVAFATVSFWLSLYLFERSWATLLGVSLGFMVYLGVPLVLIDRFLLIRHFKQQRLAEPLLYSEEHPSTAS
jgi:hypothetical protein